MLHLFEHIWMPAFVLGFVRSSYHNNLCLVVAGGQRHDGFPITAGIRQGCPLSPLLFAVAAYLLFRRPGRLLPGAVMRAYADDLALVSRAGPSDTRILEKVCAEYALISGLHLHLGFVLGPGRGTKTWDNAPG